MGLFSYMVFIQILIEYLASWKPTTKLIFMCLIVALVVSCYCLSHRNVVNANDTLLDKFDRSQMRAISDIEDRLNARERKLMEKCDIMQDSLREISLKIDEMKSSSM